MIRLFDFVHGLKARHPDGFLAFELGAAVLNLVFVSFYLAKFLAPCS